MHYHKILTSNFKISDAAVPDLLIFPVQQHIGKPAIPIVKVGDLVKRGQLIAEADGSFSANIHSSVSGTVKDIKPCPFPTGTQVLSILIENDGQDTLVDLKPNPNPKDLSKEAIIEAVFKAGIVGLGGATFPTHIKLNPDRPIEELILNGAECEPYLTVDHRLMVESTKLIFQGIEILQQIINPQKIFIGVENNKPDAIRALSMHSLHFPKVKVVSLPTKYPQGAEKVLVKKITGKRVRTLPLKHGVMVINVATVAQIAESILTGMPLVDRLVTVSGELVEKRHNYKVRIGTPIKNLLPDLSNIKETDEPYRIICGGPMMGFSQYNTEVPVIKASPGVLVIRNENHPEQTCIRCARCIDNCPVGVMPIIAANRGILAMDCMECGLCSYNCPSHINLVQRIKLQKLHIREQQRKSS